ncbi:hypothetical protein RFI_27180, partial [Reticulomyxa filosa]
HLLGDPLRPTGIFNEMRLENIVRSHIYNQDLCNKVYDEAFATMFDRVGDRSFGIEYWNAQQVKVQNTLPTSLKGPTAKMYLNEFNRVKFFYIYNCLYFFFLILSIPICLNFFLAPLSLFKKFFFFFFGIQKRAKRDVAIVQAFRNIHDRLDALKLPNNPAPKPEEPPAPLKELPTLQKRESTESLSTSELRVTVSQHKHLFLKEKKKSKDYTYT